MKFWTTQTKEVIDIILNNNIYLPDFEKSNGIGGCNMKVAYNQLLQEYNKANQLNVSGLVFGITHLDDKPVENIQQFRKFFSLNKEFWDEVTIAKECVI